MGSVPEGGCLADLFGRRAPPGTAPELLFGGVPSAASDLYSVGVLFWQMLTGTLPYGATSSNELVRRLLGAASEHTLPGQIVRIMEQLGAGTRPDGSGLQHGELPETADASLLPDSSVENSAEAELCLDRLGDAGAGEADSRTYVAGT